MRHPVLAAGDILGDTKHPQAQKFLVYENENLSRATKRPLVVGDNLGIEQ